MLSWLTAEPRPISDARRQSSPRRSTICLIVTLMSSPSLPVRPNPDPTECRSRHARGCWNGLLAEHPGEHLDTLLSVALGQPVPDAIQSRPTGRGEYPHLTNQRFRGRGHAHACICVAQEAKTSARDHKTSFRFFSKRQPRSLVGAVRSYG